jgi:glycerol-3-phosphate acyltransferase PlsX
MKIIIDVMGGDRAPLELIRGALLAQKEFGEEVILVGDEAVIRHIASENELSLSGTRIVHAPSVIHMEDHALSVVREKNDSSMSIGLGLLAEGEGDAFVSAGNTGALIAGATLLVRRIKGIQRAGIATVLPFPTPCLLMDSGANLELSPFHFEQFAFMGSCYMEKVLGVPNPRVGLVNNGAEPTKGHQLEQDAYQQLSDAEINFIGNVEGRDIPFGVCDVLVTDGFTGNVLLKYTEGIGKFMLQTLKELFGANMLTRLSAVPLRGKLTELSHAYDASEYGGAPILGISKPVIKAHGSSDARAVKNAIGQAIAFSRSGINRDIAIFAIDHEERVKQRAKQRAEAEKAREKAEKVARKQRKKEENEENVQEDVHTDAE